MGKGTVSKKQRANGLTWIYRFQTIRALDGKKVENTKVIGLVKDIGPSEAAAWREVGRLGLDNNIDQPNGYKPTFRELAEHFRQHELRKEFGIGVKAEETVVTAELLLNRWVLPRWGEKKAADIKPLEIEAWFEALTSRSQGKKKVPLSWGTIAKLKSIMAQVFKHAQRHELIAATIDSNGRPTNPMVLARSEAGSTYEAVVVTPEQMIIILNELDNPETRLEWTLALVHAATALRPEETFGLKWSDIDWQNSQIKIGRGWSKGKETRGKNEGSMTEVVMHPVLAQALQAWRRETLYHRDFRLGICVNPVEGKDSSICRCRRTRLSPSSGSEGGSNTRGISGSLRLAQSPAFAGNFLRRQRCQPACDSEHLAAREAVDNGVVHAPCELRADGGTSEVP